ncbi:MAG: hypothetical protein EPN53_09725 [Acidobacteria bacterium]|nr:MAG: hypothetical protein EPN53_09725 [Acidobacteriota bacterium]
MTVVRMGSPVAQGVMEVASPPIVPLGADPVAGSPLRRRRVATSLWVFVQLWWIIRERARLQDPSGVGWSFAIAAEPCGLLGSLPLMRAPRNGREAWLDGVE